MTGRMMIMPMPRKPCLYATVESTQLIVEHADGDRIFCCGIGPTVEPEWVRTVAITAERLGFSTVWAPEHVVLLDQYASKYPYSTGKFPWPMDIPIADPLITLAFAAACTSKIRLATGICLVPEHNPLVLAKTAATLDRLS
jgi:alkanesulfonate monooxygenase SsuD/methylene tetrahydromethanopterin reductase-like flavin-dependent oxidoreductase (luciferase family)